MEAKDILNKVIIKKEFVRNCHSCGHINIHQKEIQKCVKCYRSFLPINYFKKVHSQKGTDYNDLFDDVDNICPDSLLKGLTAIW